MKDQYAANCANARQWKARAAALMAELLAANEQYAHFRELARLGLPAGTSADSFYEAVGAAECKKSVNVQGATAPGKSARAVVRLNCSASAVRPPAASMAM